MPFRSYKLLLLTPTAHSSRPSLDQTVLGVIESAEVGLSSILSCIRHWDGLTSGSGLLSKIFSIFSTTSGVSLGRTSSAFKLSTICSGLVAPSYLSAPS